MEVATITMDPELAQEKLEAWLAEKHVDAAQSRDDCIKGYQALAEGKPLIDLAAAIRGGGFFASGFPKLAVARADRPEVYFTWRPTETVASFDTRPPRTRGRTPVTMIRQIDMKRRHGITERTANGETYSRWLDGYAQVPLLPADVRPRYGHLQDWFILWEVERWYARRQEVEPDRDPMLLEHVAGQLYAVLAEWDLTDLERAVMAGALRPEPEAR